MCGGGTTGVAPSWLDPVGVSKWGGGSLDPLHLFGNPALDKQDQLQQQEQQAEAQRQKQITQAMNDVNGIFGSKARAAEYNNYETDTYNLLKNSLDEGEKNSARNLKFGMIRSGNLGGSNDADQHGVLASDYTKGLLDASNKAQAAKGQLMSEDQALQGNIDSLILGGMSATTAEQQATRGMQADLNSAQANANTDSVDSIFGNLGQYYGNTRAAAGQNAANGTPAPTLGQQFQMQGASLAQTQPPSWFMPQWSPQSLETGGPS